MRPLDFIKTARDLAGASRQGRPRETNLRRAVSTTYYALFHCLASCCADAIAGGSRANRNPSVWNQTYRALEHRTARKRCKSQRLLAGFPPDIRNFAQQFANLQIKRHRADYDPNSRFFKNEVVQDILEVENVIRRFTMTPLKDRRAFAAYVLLPTRKGSR